MSNFAPLDILTRFVDFLLIFLVAMLLNAYFATINDAFDLNTLFNQRDVWESNIRQRKHAPYARQLNSDNIPDTDVFEDMEICTYCVILQGRNELFHHLLDIHETIKYIDKMLNFIFSFVGIETFTGNVFKSNTLRGHLKFAVCRCK